MAFKRQSEDANVTNLKHPLPAIPKMPIKKKVPQVGTGPLAEKLFHIVTKLGKQKKRFKGVLVAGD